MPGGRPKVAFVTNYVPIYRYPIYAMLRKSDDVLFKIFTTSPLAQSCREAIDGLPLKHSASFNLRRTTRHRLSGAVQHDPVSIPVGLLTDLIAFKPDVIVAGDLGVRSLICWIAAKLGNAKLVLSSEEISTSAQGRTKPQTRLRRFLIPRAHAFIAWGEPARGYLLSLDVPQSRVFCAAQAIDTSYWTALVRRFDRGAERAALSLDGVTFLLVGRAVQRKGFQNFLLAWSMLSTSSRSRACAVLVGDGEYLEELKRMARELSLANVAFVGAKGPEDLARYYAAADVFVMPSLEDVWGLVVNEALCAGLPILASRYAGAAQGLLRDSGRGLIIDPANISEFARKIHAWIDAPPPRFFDAGAPILQEVTFEKSFTAIRSMLSVTSVAQ